MNPMTLAKLADTLTSNYRIASVSHIVRGPRAVAVSSMHTAVLDEATRVAAAAGFTVTRGADVVSFSKEGQ